MDNVLEKTMFREYDIRGRESESELNANSMLLIGKSYGTFLFKRNIKDVVVGHDSRGTSEEFYNAAIDGLLSAGCRIYEVGTVTTPMLYWAQHYFKVQGGLMVTASHNPVGWNGVKLASDYSLTLGEDGIKEIYDTIVKNDFHEETGGRIVKHENILKPYADDVLGRVNIKKKFKVVVNTGNGTAGLVVPYILKRAGIEVIEHLTNIDSTYPHYTPNPAEVAMIEDTGKVVRENKADFGFAFDGDGDRLGLVDEKGEAIWPDRYFILIARLALLRKPGSKIVFDVKVSQALPEDIEAHGGIPIMWKTGHAHIKSKMRAENAVLGGELSGHIFFSDNYYGFDDAIFAALNLLEYFSTQDKTISEVIAGTPYYIASPSLHMDCPEDKKYQVVAELTDEFKKDGYKVIDINGARVSFDNGWGLVRASSNLPVLVLRFEAKDEESLKKIEKVFKDKFLKYDFLGKEWTSG
jgi:phosphomannomutase/phosphoglucomutase